MIVSEVLIIPDIGFQTRPVTKEGRQTKQHGTRQLLSDLYSILPAAIGEESPVSARLRVAPGQVPVVQ